MSMLATIGFVILIAALIVVSFFASRTFVRAGRYYKAIDNVAALKLIIDAVGNDDRYINGKRFLRAEQLQTSMWTSCTYTMLIVFLIAGIRVVYTGNLPDFSDLEVLLFPILTASLIVKWLFFRTHVEVIEYDQFLRKAHAKIVEQQLIKQREQFQLLAVELEKVAAIVAEAVKSDNVESEKHQQWVAEQREILSTHNENIKAESKQSNNK